MKRLILLLLLATSARAQLSPASSSTGSISTNASTCANTLACVVLHMASSNVGYSVTISGTWTGTLTVEQSGDNQGSWTSATTTTGNTLYTSALTPGITDVRVRGSAAMTGAAVVTITASGPATLQQITQTGAGGVSGSNTQVQVNNNGVLGGTGCINFPSLSVGPTNVDCNAAFIGPNPYVDVTRFGARSLISTQIPAVSGITASINSGSAVATVSTTSCPAQVSSACFVNGDGVVIYGAGAAHSLTTPAAPVVTPSVALAGTGTGFVANGPTGATTYCYQIVARTKNGGLTAAGPETCTVVGVATLGPVSASISSITRSNDVVTVVTSTAHGFAVGCSLLTCGEVYLSGSVDNGDLANTFNGWWAVASASDNTHFTFTSSLDTRNGSTTSATGGTAQWFNCNRVSWAQVTNAWEYYIYAGASGAETLRGISRPQGTTNIDLTWDDFGSPMMDNFTFPPFVPTNPPGAATADHLVTTIVSGAGTTTLTLANTASTTVAGKTILFDNAPNILTAATLISTRSTGGNQGGGLFFPLDGITTGDRYYVINSYLNFSGLNSVPILQAGQILLSETWELATSTKWYGDRGAPTKGAIPQFSPQGNPVVIVSSAVPGIYVNNGNLASTSVKAVTFYSSRPNGALLFFAEGHFQYEFDQSSFVTGADSSGRDDMGIGLYLRGGVAQSAAFGKLNDLMLACGSSISVHGDGSSHTPVFFCNGCGATRMTNIFTAHRGFVFAGNSAGGSVVTVDLGYMQGSVSPFFTATKLFNASVSLRNITLDTTIHPMFDALPASGDSSVGTVVISDTIKSVAQGGLNVPLVSGLPTPVIGLAAISGGGTSVNPTRASWAFTTGTSIDGIFGTDLNYAVNTNYAAVATGPNYPMFVANPPSAAPTCAASAGGTVTIATYKFKIVPQWWNGSDGVASFPSLSCTTDSSNRTLTINWNAVSGNPKAYKVAISTGGGYAYDSTPRTGLSVVYSSGSPGNGGVPITQIPSGGPTMLMPGVQGMVSPAYVLPGGVGVANTTTSAPLTTNRTTNVPDVSGTVPISGYLNSAYDNFNRANGALGANWTSAIGTVQVSGNAVKATASTGGNASAIWAAGAAFDKNQFAQATVATLNAGTDLNGPAVRYSTAGSGYTCIESTTTLSIQRDDANVRTTIATNAAISGAVGDVLRLEVTGTALTCTETSAAGVVTTLSITDATYTSGSPGVFFFGTTATLDNWSAGNLRPIDQLDIESDYTQPKHFSGITVGGFNNTTISKMLFEDCGTSTTCAQTQQAAFITIKGGPIALITGAITITSLPFTSSTTYVCSPDDSTGINGIDVVYNSGSSVTFNGTGTDSIRYVCTGN